MVFGGTRRRGLNNTSMSGDGSPFQARGRKARMGLPAKCMHFVGSPGWRGEIKITPETNSIFGASPSTMNSLFVVSLSTTKPLHPQEGVCHSHVRGRQLIFFYEHAEIFGRAPRETNSLFGASPSTTYNVGTRAYNTLASPSRVSRRWRRPLPRPSSRRG